MSQQDDFVEDDFTEDTPSANAPTQSIAESAIQNIGEGLGGLSSTIGKGLLDWVNVLNPSEKNTIYKFYKGLEEEHKKGNLAKGALDTVKSFVMPPLEDVAKVSGQVMSGDIGGAVETVARKPFDYLMDATLFYDIGARATTTGAKALSKGSGKMAERAINSLIKPRDRQFSYGKNPGRGVANEGIMATSMEDLAQKVSAKRAEIGNEISSMVSNKSFDKVKLDFSNITSPIDDAISKLSQDPRTNSAAIKRLNDTKMDIMGAIEDASGNITGYKYDLTKFTPKNAYDLKKRIGDNTKFTGAASDDAMVNKALKQTYGNIDRKLDILSPKLKKLNERYSDILGADVSIKHRENIANRADMLGLMGGVAGGIGGAIGGAGAGTIGSGGGAIAGGTIVYKILSSTPAKTAMAQAFKNGASVSEAIAIGTKKLPLAPKLTYPTGIVGRNTTEQK